MNANTPVDFLLQKIDDLGRRVYEYKNKMVAGFTQKYNVDGLVYFEVCPDIIAAITREKQIKGWSRKKKDDVGSYKKIIRGNFLHERSSNLGTIYTRNLSKCDFWSIAFCA